MKRLIVPYSIIYKSTLYRANEPIPVDEADIQKMSRLGTIIEDETKHTETNQTEPLQAKKDTAKTDNEPTATVKVNKPKTTQKKRTAKK